jgi:type VI secretion system secreted protein Hcp
MTDPLRKSSDADIFLHVQTQRAGKIKGEVTTENHVGDIEVRSWRWGVNATTAIGSTEATGRRQYKHLTVVKGLDTASTGLLSALVRNDEVKEAKLTMRKGGGEALEYYVMTLGKARVVGVDVDVDDAGKPTEQVAFAFTKIGIEYIGQSGGGQGLGTLAFDDELLGSA